MASKKEILELLGRELNYKSTTATEQFEKEIDAVNKLIDKEEDKLIAKVKSIIAKRMRTLRSIERFEPVVLLAEDGFMHRRQGCVYVIPSCKLLGYKKRRAHIVRIKNIKLDIIATEYKKVKSDVVLLGVKASMDSINKFLERN